MSLFGLLLGAHNLVRWLVILTGLVAALRMWQGWLQRKPWAAADLKAAKAFTGALSLQFVLGVLVFATSPLVRDAFGDMGRAMRDAPVRYFIVEHELMMLVAVALGHIGLSRIKKGTSDSTRFQAGAIWFGIAVAAAIGFVPWQRRLLPF